MNSPHDIPSYDQALLDKDAWIKLVHDLYIWLDLDPKDEIFKTSKKNRHVLFRLYREVLGHFGWTKTIGNNLWDNIDKKLKIQNSRKMYEEFYLVALEKKYNPTTLYSSNDISKLKSIIPENLKYIPVITPNASNTYDWDEILGNDIVIMRDFVFGPWQIDPNLMDFEVLEREHNDFPIDILTQDSKTEFKAKQASKESVLLPRYIEIMRQALTQKEAKNKILFAVNVDLGNWTKEIDELRRKLPAKILWDSKDDALKYTRQHILGMTLPQAYFKIEGCWTGGHEENLRFSAANINHGPSDVEWWALKSVESLRFRECVMRDYNFDIYTSETLWWPDHIWCLSNGFTVYHAIQKPGDLMLVGPCTIHWVKSCGVTVNSAWNFGPKKLKNFQLSFERNDINLKVDFRNLVPMHILALDLLNKEMGTLPHDLVEFLSNKIDQAYTSDKKQLEKISKAEIQDNKDDNVLCCEECYLELFRLYYRCSVCYSTRISFGGDKACIFCRKCAYKVHDVKCKSQIEIVQKFSDKDYLKLQKRIRNALNGKNSRDYQKELTYPYDKYDVEGFYRSPHEGIDTSCTSKEKINNHLEETKNKNIPKRILTNKRAKAMAMNFEPRAEIKLAEPEETKSPAKVTGSQDNKKRRPNRENGVSNIMLPGLKEVDKMLGIDLKKTKEDSKKIGSDEEGSRKSRRLMQNKRHKNFNDSGSEEYYEPLKLSDETSESELEIEAKIEIKPKLYQGAKRGRRAKKNNSDEKSTVEESQNLKKSTEQVDSVINTKKQHKEAKKEYKKPDLIEQEIKLPEKRTRLQTEKFKKNGSSEERTEPLIEKNTKQEISEKEKKVQKNRKKEPKIKEKHVGNTLKDKMKTVKTTEEGEPKKKRKFEKSEEKALKSHGIKISKTIKDKELIIETSAMDIEGPISAHKNTKIQPKVENPLQSEDDKKKYIQRTGLIPKKQKTV